MENANKKSSEIKKKKKVTPKDKSTFYLNDYLFELDNSNKSPFVKFLNYE